jgi:hypothetical protein
MMADTFQNYPASLEAPARNAFVVSEDTALDPTPRALYVGTGGTIVVNMLDGAQVVFVNVPDGSILPVRAESVASATDDTLTSTTAADIVGLV